MAILPSANEWKYRLFSCAVGWNLPFNKICEFYFSLKRIQDGATRTSSISNVSESELSLTLSPAQSRPRFICLKSFISQRPLAGDVSLTDNEAC